MSQDADERIMELPESNEHAKGLTYVQYSRAAAMSKRGKSMAQIAGILRLDVTKVEAALKQAAQKPTWHTRQNILAMLRKGIHSPEEIAAHFNVPLGSVRWTKQILLPLDGSQPEVASLIRRGFSDTEISERTGIPMPSVSYFRSANASYQRSRYGTFKGRR